MESHVTCVGQNNTVLARIRHQWTPEEEQIIRESWSKIPARDIAAKLGPSFDSNKVRCRAKYLGLERLLRTHFRKEPQIKKLKAANMERHYEAKWGGERDKIIIENWGKLSAALIGDMVGKTRNAVIGRAHRMGLGGVERAGLKTRTKPKAVKPHRDRVKIPKIKVPDAPPIIDLEIPFEQRKQLMDLGPRDCRWPVGEPGSADFFFCGAPKFGEHSYCAGHYHRAHQAWKPRVIQGGKSSAYPTSGGMQCNSVQTAAI